MIQASCVAVCLATRDLAKPEKFVLLGEISMVTTVECLLIVVIGHCLFIMDLILRRKKSFLTFCVGKIHRATVTDANLDYVGSVTIDAALVNAAGMFEGQEVTINNLTNGAHWKTYIIKGLAGHGDICLNGPPAHHFKKGDLVIILAYASIETKRARDSIPTVVHVDKSNRITDKFAGQPTNSHRNPVGMT